MTTVPRTLVNVQQELSDALQRKTRDMLKIGSLLNEAKTLVEHGEWLPWLRRHTALPARTAQQYMAAVAWADAKNATVAYLDLDYLSPGAIYALPSGKFSAEIAAQYRRKACDQAAPPRPRLEGREFASDPRCLD